VLTEVRAASGAAGSDLAQLAVAVERIAKLSGEDVNTAIARAFRSGQLGGVELRDLASVLPGILSQMGGLGSTGLRAVENASAMLQVVRDGFGTTSEAANGLNQLLSQLFSESTRRNAAELGVDLDRVFSNARRQGVDPVEALIMALRRAAGAGQGAIFSLLPDQNARQAFLALTANMGRLVEIRDDLSRAGFGVVSDAARARMEGLNAELRRFNQLTGEMGDRVGTGFGANLKPINDALESLRGAITRLDATYPSMLDGFLTFSGAAVVFTTALAAIGFIAPAVAAGFTLIKGAVLMLAGPVGLAIAAVAGAAFVIYRNWGGIVSFFGRVWAGIRRFFNSEQMQEMRRIVAAGFGAAATAITDAWGGVVAFFDDVWKRVTGIFEAAWDRVRPIVDAIRDAARLLEGRGQNPAMSPEAQSQRSDNWRNLRNGAGAFYANPVLPPAGGAQIEIEVRAAPGAEVTRAESSNRDVPLTIVPNRGPMLGLP
jgi:phage-related minor tail protein